MSDRKRFRSLWPDAREFTGPDWAERSWRAIPASCSVLSGIAGENYPLPQFILLLFSEWLPYKFPGEFFDRCKRERKNVSERKITQKNRAAGNKWRKNATGHVRFMNFPWTQDLSLIENSCQKLEQMKNQNFNITNPWTFAPNTPWRQSSHTFILKIHTVKPS